MILETEIKSRYLELLHNIATTDDPEAIAEWQEELMGAGEQYRDAIDEALSYRDDLIATQVGIKSEIARLKNLADEREVRADRIKAAVKMWMLETGETSLVLPRHNLNLRNTAGRVDIHNETLIPSEFWRVIPEDKAPDKKAIADSLKNGVPVAGCELVKEMSLTIK